MADKLWIIGIGPGTLAYIPQAVQDQIRQADILVGGPRALQLFSDHSGEKRVITGQVAELIPFLKEKLQAGRQVAVLVSGDPGFYSLLGFLRRHFAERELAVTAGLSPFQVAFAKLKEPWQGVALESVHGRELTNLLVHRGRRMALLTDNQHTARAVAGFLKEQGFADCRAVVAQDIGEEQELLLETSLFALAEGDGEYPSSILILFPTAAVDNSGESYLGLPDEAFTRGQVPMTKQEIRVTTLAKARLTPQAVVYDIGAGTGTISLEAARWAGRGRVYAIEHNPAAVELLRENKNRLGAENVVIVADEAPEAMADLPPADAVIIGGSGGRLWEIVEAALGKVRSGGRLVINAVTLETVGAAVTALEQGGFAEVEAVSVAVTRWDKVGRSHMAHALNPVWIISGTRVG